VRLVQEKGTAIEEYMEGSRSKKTKFDLQQINIRKTGEK
jgi:hypothetical protein